MHGEETLRLIETEGGKAIFRQVDIADHDATRAMVDEAVTTCGRLDIMVHNAAAFGRRSIEEMDHETLDRLFNVNVKACFTLTQASLPHMRRQGAGRIIVTSSVTGPKVSMPGSGAYATSKAAVTGFIHTAAIELAADNITVNAIEPGYIDTPGLSGLRRASAPNGFPSSFRPSASVVRRKSPAPWCSWRAMRPVISPERPSWSTVARGCRKVPCSLGDVLGAMGTERQKGGQPRKQSATSCRPLRNIVDLGGRLSSAQMHIDGPNPMKPEPVL